MQKDRVHKTRFFMLSVIFFACKEHRVLLQCVEMKNYAMMTNIYERLMFRNS